MYICQYCGKSYNYATHKSRHIRLVHRSLPRLECSLCNEMFHSREERTEHTALVHSGYLRPCPYENCNKSFKNNVMLREHICRHTDERPYTCQCGSTFICDSNYRRHKRSCVRMPALFECKKCERRFHRRDALLAHLNNKRPCKTRTIVCECGKKFSRKDALGVHMRTSCKLNKETTI